MSNFYKLVGVRLNQLPQIRISRVIEQVLQEAVIARLGLTGMGELRDRYEGQAFLDSHRTRLFSNIAIREHFGEIVRSRPLKLIEEEDNFIEREEVRYKVIVAQFGQLPLIKIDRINSDVIIVCQRDTFWISIIGVASKEVMLDLDNYRSRDHYHEFVAFDKVKKI